MYVDVPDPMLGSVRVSGLLRVPVGARTIVVIVHGLGGSADSPYAVRAAAAAERFGLASLRLNLRGADGLGEDFYHAGLTADLEAVLASHELAPFQLVHLLGFSLGGHMTLRYATEPTVDPRLRSVAAVCAPLDLESSAAEIDRKRRAPYRHRVLLALKRMVANMAKRGRALPIEPQDAYRIRTFREWDGRVVAPRHGFGSAEDYWRRASVAPRLRDLTVPALALHTRHDPMVLARTVAPALDGSELTMRWLDRGGHVGFPADLSLGMDAPPGLEPQVMTWLLEAQPARGPSA